jgi:hypothetical protein
MPKQYTPLQFAAMRPKLKKELTEALQKELQDCMLGLDDPDSDLWDDLPTVDSKTVAKLSPIVKGFLGRSLDPRWIQKGGYDSVESAVKDILDKLEKHCIGAKAASAGAATAAATT